MCVCVCARERERERERKNNNNSNNQTLCKRISSQDRYLRSIPHSIDVVLFFIQTHQLSCLIFIHQRRLLLELRAPIFKQALQETDVVLKFPIRKLHRVAQVFQIVAMAPDFVLQLYIIYWGSWDILVNQVRIVCQSRRKRPKVRADLGNQALSSHLACPDQLWVV